MRTPTQACAPDDTLQPDPLGVVPDEVRKDEQQRIAKRRGEPDKPSGDDDRQVGLALSGGGIRSATFSLGVLQALARKRLVDRLDYVSTVSGGGYIGAFLCALHVPMRLRHAAQAAAPVGQAAGGEVDDACRAARADAQAALATRDSVRVAGAGTRWSVEHPVRWLRENGRYLVPTGAGDYAVAVAVALRNLLAVHYVLGTALLTVFVGLCLLKCAGYGWLANGRLANGDTGPGWLWDVLYTVWGGLWWSPLLALALLVALLGVPLGLAFFMTQPPAAGENPRPIASVRVVAAAVIASLAAWGTAACLAGPMRPAPAQAVDTTAALRRVLWAGGAAGLLGVVVFLGMLAWHALGPAVAGRRDPGSESGTQSAVQAIRSQLTRGLGRLVEVALALLGLAVIDTAAQSAFARFGQAGASWPALSGSVAAAAFVWLLRAVLPRLSAKAQPAWTRSLPLGGLATLAGVALFVLVAVAWDLAAHAVLGSVAGTDWLPAPWGRVQALAAESPSPPTPGALRALAAVWALTFVLMTATGLAIGFLNLSSLQSLYSARLTRAYLGASNRERHDQGRWQGVTEPHPLDNLELHQYYHPQVRAPLHLINLTLNQTTAAGEQLVQRDRKGRPVCVSPGHLCVDGAFFRRDDRERRLHPVGGTARSLFGEPQRGFRYESLPVGQWCAISGAAFSTGLGSRTSLGLSLLCVLANVRLGYWWDARALSKGYRRRPHAAGGQPGAAARLKAAHRRRRLGLWDAQVHLFDELRARFRGCTGRLWYLSDGGHFENTAGYELVRRRVRFIVIVDNGADPDYAFADLANLMRLCRIDFGAEFWQADAATVALPDFIERRALVQVCGTMADFGDPGKREKKAALVYEVSYPRLWRRSTVLVVKPSVLDSAPPDIREYATCNQAFPQQPTADQFFDQAQWESYRQLGAHIMGTLTGGHTPDGGV